MKRIITALGNPTIAKEIEKNEKFKIMSQDIQYQEAIFDIIEQKEIDILILSAILPGEYNIEELIEKIKEKENDIEIIIFLEKEDKILEKKLNLKGIKNIFYHNQVEITEFEKKIKIEKTEKRDIEEIKDLIIKKEMPIKKYTKINDLKKYMKNILENKLMNIINKIKKTNKKSDNKIISILGSSGIGKSIFTTLLGLKLAEKNKKVLIIDFDLLNQSIKTILGIDSKKIEKNYIIKVNTNLDLIYGIELLFGEKEKIKFEKIKEILNSLKTNYDIILIDTSSECYFHINRKLIKLSNYGLFLTEGNFLEMQKSNNLLKIYNKEWEIEKEKINIIYNKFTENAIDIEILKKTFSDYNVIGKIELNKNYSTLINQNVKNGIMEKTIKKEYTDIVKKLEKYNIV